MNNSLKIGAISGLLAGFVSGIVFIVLAKIAVSIGLWLPVWRPIIPNSDGVTIVLELFWGIVLGIIFSKTYRLIPGRDALKGLIYGLILFVLIYVRIDTFWAAYSYYPVIAADLFTQPPAWIAYGVVLGILYSFLSTKYSPIKKEPEIAKYSMKGGLLPGAIAGFSGGMAASIVAILGPALGLWPPPAGPVTFTITFWMSQAGAHIFVNMIWGTIFGSMFPRVYEVVPSSGVKKGLCYGLTVYLITTFAISTYLVGWAALHNAWLLAASAAGMAVFGAAQAIVFGLVLGVLYRK